MLAGIDLHLEPGDRIGILGPNGVGKSTLLDILAGKQRADLGTLLWGETVQVGYYDQRSADLRDSLRLIEFIEQEAPLIRTKDGARVEAAQMLEWFLVPSVDAICTDRQPERWRTTTPLPTVHADPSAQRAVSG